MPPFYIMLRKELLSCTGRVFGVVVLHETVCAWVFVRMGLAHGCNCASACTAVNGHKVNTVNVQLATVKHILTVVVAAILCILESPQPLE